ncbi:MAG TPA: class I SAM-dependent methyltransferase [Natrialbaceae archaeon]|nr:class I SAM-dependent methyltransferase [Natrialbaceae archaeon]
MNDDLAETMETYDRVAGEYRKRHEDREPLADQVDRFCEAVDGSIVLDVGCGPGWESATFAERGFEVLGMDLTPGLLDIATDEAPTVDFARMDMRTLGVADGAVDGIWACASFLHVPRSDAQETLAGFRRVLRDGGVLWLSVKRGSGTRPGDTYEGDDREFTLYRADELRELVSDAGLTVEFVSDGEWIQVLARAD